MGEFVGAGAVLGEGCLQLCDVFLETDSVTSDTG